MNTSKRSLEAIARVALVLLAATSAGCGDDGGSVTPNPDGGATLDAGEDLAYPPGGNIPPPPDGAEAPIITIDANYTPEQECCPVELSIPDPDGNEAVARLLGDQAPLNQAGGVPLTHSNGRWRATVCLPTHTWIKYRFHFGTKMVPAETPPPPDASTSDGEVDAGVDAGTTAARQVAFRGGIRADDADGGPLADAGAGLESDGDDKPEAGEAIDAEPPPVFSPDAPPAAEPDAALVTVDDYRCTTEAPQVTEAEGTYNLFSALTTCSSTQSGNAAP